MAHRRSGPIAGAQGMKNGGVPIQTIHPRFGFPSRTPKLHSNHPERENSSLGPSLSQHPQAPIRCGWGPQSCQVSRPPTTSGTSNGGVGSMESPSRVRNRGGPRTRKSKNSPRNEVGVVPPADDVSEGGQGLRVVRVVHALERLHRQKGQGLGKEESQDLGFIQI